MENDYKHRMKQYSHAHINSASLFRSILMNITLLCYKRSRVFSLFPKFLCLALCTLPNKLQNNEIGPKISSSSANFYTFPAPLKFRKLKMLESKYGKPSLQLRLTMQIVTIGAP